MADIVERLRQVHAHNPTDEQIIAAAIAEIERLRANAGWRPPEGWKLVPVVPTETMIEAGWIDKEDVNPDEIYAVMLAAAPAPPQEK